KNNLLIMLALPSAFIALTGFLIYRQQKLRNRQQAQEHELKTAIAHIETQNKLYEQRLAISRDLHDNIGAQLTFIISSVDNIKYAFDLSDTKLDRKLQSISSFTRETILELRDTIWAMNTNDITFHDLIARILNFIDKARNAKENVDFDFSIDETLSRFTLSSVTGMNVYRMIQEAVNNAIKYSHANNIKVSIRAIADQIAIVIADDGVGFDPAAVQRGNGLLNMQKRVAEINGKLSIDSLVGSGTQITVQFPKQQHE